MQCSHSTVELVQAFLYYYNRKCENRFHAYVKYYHCLHVCVVASDLINLGGYYKKTENKEFAAKN